MTALISALPAGSFLVNEDPDYGSRDEIIVNAGQTILSGQVLGKTSIPAALSASVRGASGNTGNGVLTVASINGPASDGVYTVVMLAGGATAAFEVLAPNGSVVGAGDVGTAFGGAGTGGSPFVGPISFSIAAGGSAFAAGDQFQISVVATQLPIDTYEAWSPSATDGSQVAAAIAFYPITTGASTSKGVAITRRAQVRQSDITFAVGASASQINEAIEQLSAPGITMR